MNAEDITQLYRQKNYALAEKEAKAALLLDPNNVHLLYIYALIMSAQMQFAPALGACSRILKQEPNHAYALSALVTCCVQLGLPDLAEAHIQQCSQTDSPTTQSWLAGLYGSLAMYDHAIDSQSKVCAAHPNDPYARYMLGTLQMSAGLVDEGMRNYQHHASRNMVRTYRTDMLNNGWDIEKYWEGESVAGKTILICPMGGYGDFMQFCRYVKALKDMGAARVLGLMGNPRIHGLLRSCADLEVIDRHEDHAFDLWTDPFGLCAYLQPTHGFMSQDRYLTPPASDWADQVVQTIQARAAGKRCIGISWHSDTADAGTRSVPLATLLPLFGLPDIHWVIMQRGLALEEFRASGLGQLCTIVSEDATFDDTAAIVNHLEAVVSIDSYMTHLTAAIGKPVYFMASRALDWRHMNNETQSPWYPRTTIVRQPMIGDWRSVVQQLCTLLTSPNA